MTGAKAFGIAFKVEDKIYNAYKNRFNLDLEEHSGQTHHLLPVPAVYIFGTDGKVRFQYVNPDYKVRLDFDVLLAAAKSAVK